jgi:hypothetical protein
VAFPLAALVALARGLEGDDRPAVLEAQAQRPLLLPQRAGGRVVIGGVHLGVAVVARHLFPHHGVAEQTVELLQIADFQLDFQFGRHKRSLPDCIFIYCNPFFAGLQDECDADSFSEYFPDHFPTESAPARMIH